MHLYKIRKHNGKQKKIIFEAETLEIAKNFVNEKIKKHNIDFFGLYGFEQKWTISDEKDLIMYINKYGIIYTITGYDTNTEYEDL